MAVRWAGAERTTAMEIRDIQAGAMAIDNSGTNVLLAGRRCIALLNLDDPDHDKIRKFPRQSKYEVSCAEWNPTSDKSELCVIACNQRLELLNWSEGQLVESAPLRAHTRVITDISWHRSDPNILASCSVDTFIHIWDLRDTKRPSLSLSAIAEASQVRWNRVSDHILATSHDGDVKLWDNRKGTSPVQYITAHLTKIHGLDWHPTIENQLVTSSQDSTVKFFDTNNPRRPEYMLSTHAPVWRARFTPFGNGLVTVVVPQLRRGENSLLLWNTANRNSPIHTFVGHKDVVIEFGWRNHKSTDRDFELVTWSKDQTLLVWRIEPFLQKLCGYEPDDIKQDISSRPESVASKRSNMFPEIDPLSLEFSLLNSSIPNLEVLKLDLNRRICVVKANANNTIVTLQVTFPNNYPTGTSPTFQVIPETTADDSSVKQILDSLGHLAQLRVIKGRSCLEPCLRQLITLMEQASSDNRSTYIENPNLFGTISDTDIYIPFPKTSGAKFCSVNTLICFSRPNIRKLSSKPENATPRALSALAIWGGRSNNSSSLQNYYPKQKMKGKHGKHSFKAYAVIYDASNLFPLNKELAERYSLLGDAASICRYNAKIAGSIGRMDLVQAWNLAELVSNPKKSNDMCYERHPMFSGLMQSLVDHYTIQQDVQMAAMLCCLVGKEKNAANSRKSSLKSLLSCNGGGSPYHTIPPADVVEQGWVFPLLQKARSSSLDNLRMEEPAQLIEQVNPNVALHEYYKAMYAEILYRWGLLHNRAEIAKHFGIPPEIHKGVEFLSDCQHCSVPTRGANCVICRRMSLICVICHISVRGSVNCCVVCGHGGHMIHMKEWFDENEACPTGCGCKCLFETTSLLEV